MIFFFKKTANKMKLRLYYFLLEQSAGRKKSHAEQNPAPTRAWPLPMSRVGRDWWMAKGERVERKRGFGWGGGVSETHASYSQHKQPWTLGGARESSRHHALKKTTSTPLLKRQTTESAAFTKVPPPLPVPQTQDYTQPWKKYTMQNILVISKEKMPIHS